MLLGNADDIVLHLCHKLGWDLPDVPTPNGNNLDAPKRNLKKRPSAEFETEPRRVGDRYACGVRLVCSSVLTRAVSHVWLFEGAEGGRWVDEIERKYQESLAEASGASTPLSSPPSSVAGDSRQQKKARVQ